mgnify:CR=1 FL=1
MLIPSKLDRNLEQATSLSRRVNANSQLMVSRLKQVLQAYQEG